MRVPYSAAVLLGLALTAGCKIATAPSERAAGWVDVGERAADTARAHALVLSDRMDLLVQERDQLDRRRTDALRDRQAYLDKSARSLDEPNVPDWQRGPAAREYSFLAENRQDQAERYGMLVGACEADVSLMNNERQSALRAAENFDAVKFRAPQ